MLETKEQKQYFITAVVLVVILVAVSALNRTNFNYVDKTDYAKQNQNIAESQAYLKYLQSVPIDRQASQKLFQTLLTEAEITQAVEKALRTDQSVVLPEIDEAKLRVLKSGGQEAVAGYLRDTVSEAVNFNNQTLELNQTLFSADAEARQKLQGNFEEFFVRLQAISVPEEVMPLHRALLTAYTAYGRTLALAKNFNAADLTQNDSLWPELYQDYAVVNDSMKTYTAELQKAADKYQLTEVTINLEYAGPAKEGGRRHGLVKEAQALSLLGVNFSFTLGDIPRIIMDAVKEGLKSAFLQFMGGMLQNLITKIEQNYLIANFLYYSDALISGQYANDYLQKYVSDQLDREIVKKFIPQFSCGTQPQDLRPVFKAKAESYLGFDPQSLDPRDPDYYQKMARVGDFLASPSGWELYFEDLANTTKSEAEKAAEKELLGTGLKSPRDLLKTQIGASISSIVSAERASFTALLQLGISNADSIISGFVSRLTQTLVNQFVFRGVTNNSGSLAVLKEQPTCVASAQVAPVLPMSETQYQTPPPAQSQEQVIEQQCRENPELCPRGEPNPTGGNP